MKEDALQRLSGSEFRDALLLNGEISRLRQAAEWGNGNFQSIWAHLQAAEWGKVARGCYQAFEHKDWTMWIHSDPYCLFRCLYGRGPWFLYMNPGIGLAEVLAEPQPQESSQS